MTEMQAGQQYLVTNIKFKHSNYGTINAGYQRLHDFKVPADLADVHGWLDEYDCTCSDKIALAIYVRSIMFYNFDMTYDFQLIKELPVPNVYQIEIPTFPDLADQQYAEYKPATIQITVPTAYIATLSADDINFADNDIEQALFENMLRNLQIDFNVYSITDLILETMADCMNEIDPTDPDNIAQLSLDALYDGQITDQKANELYDCIHSLASALVKEPGKYM